MSDGKEALGGNTNEAAESRPTKRVRRTAKRGKKKWKTEISTEPVEDKNFESMVGASAANISDKDLFFIDRGKKRGLKEKQTHAETVISIKRVDEERKRVKKVAKKPSTRKSGEASGNTVQAEAEGEINEKKSELFDLWDDEDEDKAVADRPKTTKHKLAPAVEIPSTALSYHPTHEAHQEGLRAAYEYAEKEEKANAYNMRAGRVVKGKGVQKVIDKDIEEANSVPADALDESNLLQASRMLTKRDRKKKRKQEGVKGKVEAKKERKRRQEQADNIAHYAKEVKTEIAHNMVMAEERRKYHETTVVFPKNYKESMPDFMLTSELPDKLVHLKSQKNLYNDRMDSIQKRGMVALRKPERAKKKRDAKAKWVVKESFL